MPNVCAAVCLCLVKFLNKGYVVNFQSFYVDYLVKFNGDTPKKRTREKRKATSATLLGKENLYILTSSVCMEMKLL